jgi:hypothetical protein
MIARSKHSIGQAATLCSQDRDEQTDKFVCTVVPSEDPDAEGRLIEALKWLLGAGHSEKDTA